MKLRNLAISAGILVAFAAPASANAVTLIGSGSIAAQPVLEPLFKQYTKATKGKVKFVYTANGGNAGVKDVQNGKSQFAGQARLPLPSDAGTTYIKAYLDGACMNVNPKNTLSNITIPTLRNIFTGVSTNWSQVSGSNLTTTIDPVGRDTNGGQYNFFLQAVLNNQLPSGNVNALTSEGLVVNAIRQNQNAIGYNSLAWTVRSKGLRTLKLEGQPCAPKAIKSLKYPLSRFIFFVVPLENPNAEVLKFINWARRDRTAGKIINKAGGVAAFNKGA